MLVSHSNAKLQLAKICYGYPCSQNDFNVNALLSEAFTADIETYEETDGIGRMAPSNHESAIEKKRQAIHALYTIKNPAFMEEREWRIFLTDRIRHIEEVDFREALGVISPFIRISVPTEAFFEVRMGPANKTPKIVVEDLLIKYEVKASVHKSSASYVGR